MLFFLFKSVEIIAIIISLLWYSCFSRNTFECLACVASVSVRFSARSRHFLFFSRAKIGANAKKCVTGERKGEKATLARKPHDFEKPVRPRTEFPDWRGMVVLIAK